MIHDVQTYLKLNRRHGSRQTAVFGWLSRQHCLAGEQSVGSSL